MRHGIVFQNLSGENASVPTIATEDWLKTLSSLLQKYDPDDIFNADGIVFFFRMFVEQNSNF